LDKLRTSTVVYGIRPKRALVIFLVLPFSLPPSGKSSVIASWKNNLC